MPWSPRYETAENKTGPVLEAIYNGTAKPADALTKLAADIDALK